MYNAAKPKTLKRILEKHDYELVSQDDITWIMESNGHPIVISQTMDRVPGDILESMLAPSGIDEATFNKLLAEIESPAIAAVAVADPSAEKPTTPPVSPT